MIVTESHMAILTKTQAGNGPVWDIPNLLSRSTPLKSVIIENIPDSILCNFFSGWYKDIVIDKNITKTANI
jgi:hypothetical protein